MLRAEPPSARSCGWLQGGYPRPPLPRPPLAAAGGTALAARGGLLAAADPATPARGASALRASAGAGPATS